MEIAYIIAAVALLPLAGAGLCWLRDRSVSPAILLQQALSGLNKGTAADLLLGLLGWFAPALAIGGLAGGMDVFSAALLLELAALAPALFALQQGRTWTQLAGARRVQFALFYNLGYIVALVALIALAGRLDLTSVSVWPNGSLRIAVHLVALLAILLALPAELEAHPFAVSADAEAASKLNLRATPPELGRLAYEAALLIFVAALLLPSPGTWWGQLALIAALTLLLTLLVRFFSRSISVRLRPDQAYDFYWLYGLTLAAVIIIGTIFA